MNKANIDRGETKRKSPIRVEIFRRQLLECLDEMSETRHVCVCVCVLTQSYPTLCDPMDCSLLCPWDFPDENIGVGCHFLLQGIFPDPGIELVSLTSPALTGRFFTTAPPGKPQTER